MMIMMIKYRNVVRNDTLKIKISQYVSVVKLSLPFLL